MLFDVMSRMHQSSRAGYNDERPSEARDVNTHKFRCGVYIQSGNSHTSLPGWDVRGGRVGLHGFAIAASETGRLSRCPGRAASRELDFATVPTVVDKSAYSLGWSTSLRIHTSSEIEFPFQRFKLGILETPERNLCLQRLERSAKRGEPRFKYCILPFRSFLLFQAYNDDLHKSITVSLLLVGDGDVLSGHLLEARSDTITVTGSPSQQVKSQGLTETYLIFSVVLAFWPFPKCFSPASTP